MDTVHIYKQKLASIINDGQAFQEAASPLWAELVPLITKEVLYDAHTSCQSYANIFNTNNLNAQARPLKTMERIVVKSQATRPDVPFKVNSDLCALRFETYDVTEIKHIMEVLRKKVEEEQGVFYIRNSIEDGEGKLTDIIQYAFAFIPHIGYVVELQVGHPFAVYTFTVDSIIRDKRLAGASVDGIVDLWDNGFYGYVKSLILNKQTPFSIADVTNIYPTKSEMVNDAQLMNILNTIAHKHNA
jgi:hypothetical protein